MQRTDEIYRSSKRIKQGQTSIAPEFINLQAWIESAYGIKPFNIEHKEINTSNGIRPIITLVFDTAEDTKQFYEPSSFRYNQNTRIENDIVQKCKELISKKYNQNNLGISYAEFHTPAREETISKITETELKELISKWNDPRVWNLVVSFGTITLFFYTESERKTITNHTLDQWKNDIYKLVKKYDEFDVFDEDTSFILNDSKEIFDINYNSNWEYYFR